MIFLKYFWNQKCDFRPSFVYCSVFWLASNIALGPPRQKVCTLSTALQFRKFRCRTQKLFLIRPLIRRWSWERRRWWRKCLQSSHSFHLRIAPVSGTWAGRREPESLTAHAYNSHTPRTVHTPVIRNTQKYTHTNWFGVIQSYTIHIAALVTKLKRQHYRRRKNISLLM